MESLIQSQIYAFVAYILSGVVIGLYFDIFRIVRKVFNTSDIITIIQDIVFWITTGIFLIYIIFTINSGEIRAYIFIGLLIGNVIYMLLISKYFLNMNIKILMFFKNLILEKKE